MKIINQLSNMIWKWACMFMGIHVFYFFSVIFYMINQPETATNPYKVLLVVCFLLTFLLLREEIRASACLDLAIDTEDDLDRANIFRRRMESILKKYDVVIKSLAEESSPAFKDNAMRLAQINDMLINLAIDDGFLVDTTITISKDELDNLKLKHKKKS